VIYYYCESCRHCRKQNMVYGGDPEDITGFDPTGFKCWHCGEITEWDDDGWEPDTECIDESKPTTEDAVQIERKRCAGIRKKAVERERRRCVELVKKWMPSDLDKYDYADYPEITATDVIDYARYRMEELLKEVEGGTK
jgi:hypothetical protein